MRDMDHNTPTTENSNPAGDQVDKRPWAPLRPNHCLAKEKLDRKMLDFNFSGNIGKAHSFKGTTTSNELSCSSPSFLPDVHEVPTTAIYKASDNGLTAFRVSQSAPASSKTGLLRSATLRATRLLFKIPNQLPIRILDPEAGGNAHEEREPLEKIRFRIQPSFRQPAQYFDYICLVKYFEDSIRHKIQDFPSIRLQNRNGSNYIPSWNWIAQIQTIGRELIRDRQDFSSREANEILERFQQYLARISEVQKILGKLCVSFDHGIEEWESEEFEDKVSSLSKDFKLCKTDGRGTSIITEGMLPYVAEVFQNDKKRQEKYLAWMGRCLTDSSTIAKRNELVKWVLKTAIRVKFAAETAHLAVYIIDVFLTTRGTKMSTPAWLALGITALHIAGKKEEVQPVSANRLIRLSGQFYKPEEIVWMERCILKKLKYDIDPPLAPLFAQMVLLCGSLDLPSVRTKKIVMDLAMAVLHKSLLNHTLSQVQPIDKAKAALEIAIEYVYYQLKIFNDLKSVDRYEIVNEEPGKLVGEFAVSLCFEIFFQRFKKEKVVLVTSNVHFTASPVREVNAS